MKLSQEELRELGREFDDRDLSSLCVMCEYKLKIHPRGVGHEVIGQYIFFIRGIYSLIRDYKIARITLREIDTIHPSPKEKDDSQMYLTILEIINYIRTELNETI